LYVRDGKIQTFNCHIGMTTMFGHLGVLADFPPPQSRRPRQNDKADRQGRVTQGSDGLLS
jgi:hypothetical protein